MKLNSITCGILSLISTVLISCSSFLDEEPFSFAEGDELFTSGENLEMALTGVYDVITEQNIQGNAQMALWARNIHLLTMLGCDEVIGRTDFIATSDFKAFCNYAYNPESRYLYDAWYALYAGIYRANNVIENAVSVEMDNNRKAEIIAEVRYLRAFYYSYLTCFWGAVPTPISTEDNILAPRSNIQAVYEIIIDDFKHAYEALPERNSLYSSRINKYAAAGMLAKAYLYLASCKENNVGKEFNFELNSFDWVNAGECYATTFDLCKDVVENSGYILHDEYRYMFMADNTPVKSEQIKEAMMIAPNGRDGMRYYAFTNLTGPAGNVNTNGGGAGWFPAMGELAELYNTQDARYKQNIGGALLTTKEAILNVEYYLPSGLYQSGTNCFLTKFRQSTPESRTAAGIPTYSSILNLPILRFSDVILMYSEAAYKTGNEPLARSIMEAIRLRAAKNNQNTADLLTGAYYKADFMEELKDERSRELCGEGWRRFDLIRWGKLGEVVANLQTTNLNNVAPDVYYYNTLFAQPVKDNFENYKIWYPVPLREIEVNRSLKQNPGYAGAD